MNYKALSLACLMLAGGLEATGWWAAKSNGRQLALCCGAVSQKCARACVGKSCDISCDGTCGILNTRCGPYKCSQVTTACASSSATTTATTAAATTTGTGAATYWPQEPVVVNTYEAKGQMIDLDMSMKAYQTGSGSKMVVWSHDIFGLTGMSSDMGRTKEWADMLADNGYNVLVPDWFRGNNMPDFFGPLTFPWLTSVTNWTNIQSDWFNVILPHLQAQSPSSIGLIGTCWGSYPVVRLSMLDTISAGISMHPSHNSLLASAGDDEAEILGLIKSPQLFLVEGEAADTFKAGGLSEKVLGEKLTRVDFPEMTHGWTVRGDLAEPAVARDVKIASYYVLDFFGKYLN